MNLLILFFSSRRPNGKKELARAQPVIPEVPVGTIVASVSMALALLGYFALAKLKRKSTD